MTERRSIADLRPHEWRMRVELGGIWIPAPTYSSLVGKIRVIPKTVDDRPHSGHWPVHKLPHYDPYALKR